MEKKENDNLFLETIRYHFASSVSELKGNSLYLANENISVADLAQIITKPAGDIVAFF
jgi:hypothetical protein